MKRLLWFLLAAALLIPAVASAHAVLVESSIANGATLGVAPESATLRFSEGVDPSYSSIELYGENSIPIALDHATFPGRDTIQIALPPTLRPGSYTLVYRVLSAADGHKSVGFLIFSVGTGAAPVQPAPTVLAASADSGPSAASLAAKALEAAAGLAVLGGLVWLVAFLLPAGRKNPAIQASPAAGRAVWLVQWSLLALIVGTAAEFALRAADLGDGTFASLQYADVVSSLATSRWGMLALARLAGATLLIPLAFLAARRRAPGEAAIGLSALVLLTFSMSGHAAATPSPLLPIIADWVHLLAGALWFGGVIGLAGLALALPPGEHPGERAKALVPVIARFSPLALGSIVVVSLTGALRSLEQIPALADLWGTRYGQTLLIKLAVLLAALLLGALHWRRSGPRMQSAQDDSQAVRFGRTVAIESLLAVGVVLLAGTLSQTPHPVAATASAQNSSTSGSSAAPPTLPTPTPIVAQPLALTAASDGLTLTLALDDRRPGPHTFTAAVSDTNGLIAANRVRLRFEALDIETGQQIAILEARPDGTYQGQSGAISLLGKWKIEMQVRRVNLPDVTVAWTVEITR